MPWVKPQQTNCGTKPETEYYTPHTNTKLNQNWGSSNTEPTQTETHHGNTEFPPKNAELNPKTEVQLNAKLNKTKAQPQCQLIQNSQMYALMANWTETDKSTLQYQFEQKTEVHPKC